MRDSLKLSNPMKQKQVLSRRLLLPRTRGLEYD
jgi:hypothetical protein